MTLVSTRARAIVFFTGLVVSLLAVVLFWPSPGGAIPGFVFVIGCEIWQWTHGHEEA